MIIRNLDLEMVEFTLQQVLVACISQVMGTSKRKGVQIVNAVVEDVVTRTLYGDSARLQQVLADFLLTSLEFTSTGSQLSISACLTTDRLSGEAVHLARLELRYVYIYLVFISDPMFSWMLLVQAVSQRRWRRTGIFAEADVF